MKTKIEFYREFNLRTFDLVITCTFVDNYLSTDTAAFVYSVLL